MSDSESIQKRAVLFAGTRLLLITILFLYSCNFQPPEAPGINPQISLIVYSNTYEEVFIKLRIYPGANENYEKGRLFWKICPVLGSGEGFEYFICCPEYIPESYGELLISNSLEQYAKYYWYEILDDPEKFSFFIEFCWYYGEEIFGSGHFNSVDPEGWPNNYNEGPESYVIVSRYVSIMIARPPFE